MLSTARSRAVWQFSRRAQVSARRCYAFSVNDQLGVNDPKKPKEVSNVSKTNELPTEPGHLDARLQENAVEGEKQRVMQAPNRPKTWSGNQNPREQAMTGPRFEQTIMEYQPKPQAAISLVHKQPVRWTNSKAVSCDGGGGPLGHPRIFINTDKPEISVCGYCGIPFAHEHHRKHLESLPETAYPLAAQGDPAEINESQRITDEGLGQR